MGRSKALLEWGGVTVLDHMIELVGGIADPVIVVAGYGVDEIREREAKATLIENPNPERGMLSSLKCGLRAVPPEAGAVLFTPVDHPAVSAGTLSALAAAAAVGAPLAIPVFEGRRGHPVLISCSLIGEILALADDGRASDVIHRHLCRAIMVQVNDRGTVEDIDDPETYERLRREAGRS